MKKSREIDFIIGGMAPIRIMQYLHILLQGAVDRYNCIYVKPQTGQSTYKFDIMYDQCGSKPDLNGRFYENNIVIQYDKDLIEVSEKCFFLRLPTY